jgi:putative transposase
MATDSQKPPPAVTTVRKTRRSYNTYGHAREITFSCFRRMPLLSRERTRLWLLEAIDNARARLSFELWAYVVMPEHVHLLLVPLADTAEIAPILKAIKQPVARKATNYLRANNPTWLEHLKVQRTDGRPSYRFWQQGGGYDRNIFTDKAAWAAVDYIHDNPVRRGLVQCALDWPWSSATWYAGARQSKPQVDPSLAENFFCAQR